MFIPYAPEVLLFSPAVLMLYIILLLTCILFVVVELSKSNPLIAPPELLLMSEMLFFEIIPLLEAPFTAIPALLVFPEWFIFKLLIVFLLIINVFTPVNKTAFKNFELNYHYLLNH